MLRHNSRRLGHHERVHSRSRLLGALTAVAAASCGVLVAALPVGAASCSVMNFQFDPASGGVILSPQKLTVANGACVTLHNSTITSADFTVGAHYKQTAPAFSDATPNYVAGPAGSTQAVTASGAAGSARGSIVVQPAPKPVHSSAPPTHSPAPQPSHSASPSARPTPTKTSAPPPTASPPPVTPIVSPPAGSTPFLAGQPTPTPSPSHSTTVVSGPLQPPTDRGTGLPAALAALAVVGTAAALLRVLLAEPIVPVDERHRAPRAAL